MENFSYQCETKILFGKGTENKVGIETRQWSNRILLHYGGDTIKKIGLYDKIIKSLDVAGVKYFELGGVVPNPRLSLVREGIRLCVNKEIDFILAVGGGSVIDSAKAIASGVPYQGDVWDFFANKVPIGKALPVGVVLTIPAAGSESSPNSVITDEKTKRKLPIGSDILRPKFAIMDPELTFSLPQSQTAAGIADMYAHIIERYFSNTDNTDLTDKMCEAVMRAIIKNAKLVIKNPMNYDYRAEIMLSSTIAHNGILGIGRQEDWASHRIEHELSAMYDVTHGAGLAVIVPAWMEFALPKNRKRFAQYAKNVFGLDTEKAGIEATRAFFKEIGLPTTLRELKVPGDKIEEMAKLCGPVGNYVKLSVKDIVEIYKIANK